MPSKTRPADGMYRVRDGEWVGSIAYAHGIMEWRQVWNDPANRALREKRVDPHVLAEGDDLFIPLIGPPEVPVATGQRHVFKLRAPTQLLRVRLLDALGEPLADEPYELQVECEGVGSFAQQNARSDGDGAVSEQIPMTAVRGTLRLTDRNETLSLRIGHLTPIDLEDDALKFRGVQERLAALGFYAGEIDGLDGPRTRAAVKMFQRFCRAKAGSSPDIQDPGPVDGVVGPRTRRALLNYFGS